MTVGLLSALHAGMTGLMWCVRQATAQAYAEREVLEACMRQVGEGPAAVAEVLRPLVALYALRRLELDAGWLLSEGLLALSAGRSIPAEIRCAPRLYITYGTF